MTLTIEVDAFFAEPNEVARDGIGGSAGELLEALVGRLEATGARTVLPARVAGSTRWYGIATTDADARLLFEEMEAWLGPPISGMVCPLRSAVDATDAAALRLAGSGTVLRTDISAGWQRQARENINGLFDSWSLAPVRGFDRPRPVGRVLRDFYDGLLAGDRSVAESALGEIRTRSLLTSTNTRFLRIELIGSLGTAEELRDDPALRDVSLLARPPAVTEHLARAANALVIEPTAASSDTDWRRAAEQVEGLWPGIITQPSQVRSTEGARCLALTEILTDHPRSDILAGLRTDWGVDEVLLAILDEVSLPAPTIPTGESALALYQEGRYEKALNEVELGVATSALAGLALHAAHNLADPTSTSRALRIVDRLTESDRQVLLRNAVDRHLFELLTTSIAGKGIPSSWLDWLAGDWPDRPDLLREWSRDWPDTLEDDVTFAEVFLDALNDERRGRTRNGLPVFIEWLVGDGGLEAGKIPLAVTLFDFMLGSEPGRVERQASLTLLDEILTTGCDAREYSEILNALAGQLRLIGPRDAGWLAASIDLLLLSAVADPAARTAFVSESFSAAFVWASRVDSTDTLLLSNAFADAGFEYPSVETQGESDETGQQIRTFRKVGIYSLLEPAALTAARWIKDRWPGVQVTLSHDHVNSRSLEAVVRGSDVVLVQTSRAKHAATNAIRDAARDDESVVLVHGRGATALLRALLRWTSGV